jgi:serine/threonine protein phosphatase PrpC
MNKTAITLHKTSLCGYRESNEDVELYYLNLDTKGNAIDPSKASADVFIVCDGHGGHEVAQIVAPTLLKYLTHKSRQYPLSDRKVNQLYDKINYLLIKKYPEVAESCGCTCLAVIRYIDRKKKTKLQVFNVGDSRAVLSRKTFALPLSHDHKPNWPDEYERLKQLNRKLKKTKRKEPIYEDDEDCWRIDGLSVSRAFGDLESTPHITHKPDIFNYKLNKSDEFMILACDGLWDILSCQEAVNFVRDHLHEKDVSQYIVPGFYPVEGLVTDNIARKLAEYAIARGSNDNVSVIIVFL